MIKEQYSTLIKRLQQNEFDTPTGNSFCNGNSKISNNLIDLMRSDQLDISKFNSQYWSQVVEVSYVVSSLNWKKQPVAPADIDKVRVIDAELFDTEIIMNIAKISQRDYCYEFSKAMSSGAHGSLD